MRVPTDDLVGFRLDSARLGPCKGGDVAATAALGLQDSAPWSALLSMHARLGDVGPDDWRDPRLVQVWGPRGAIYLIPRTDRALFTVGLTPRSPDARDEVRSALERLPAYLSGASAGEPIPEDVMGTGRAARLAATITGRVSLVWDARSVSYFVEDPVDVDVESARRGLARRFLEVFAPASPRHFARWSGVAAADAEESLRALGDEVQLVSFHDGERLLLRSQIERLGVSRPPAGVRLLPPGDPYLGGPDRELLVPEQDIRSALWPASVPPGALLVDGRVTGTWRRRGGDVTLHPFGRLSTGTTAAIEREIDSMPLPGPTRPARPPRTPPPPGSCRR